MKFALTITSLLLIITAAHSQQKPIQKYSATVVAKSQAIDAILKPLMMKVDMACRPEFPPELQSLRASNKALNTFYSLGMSASELADESKKAQEKALVARTQFTYSSGYKNWIKRRNDIRVELKKNAPKLIKDLRRLSNDLVSISPVPKGLKQADQSLEKAGEASLFIANHLNYVIANNNSEATESLIDAQNAFYLHTEKAMGMILTPLQREKRNKVYQ